MKNGSEGRDLLSDSRNGTVPIDRGRKVQTALRVNQIAGFVTVPSEKKVNIKFGKEIKDSSCIELETKEKETSDIFL